MEIKYTKMTKQNYKDIKRLVSEAWFADYTFSKRIINLYSNYYLYFYLGESNYRMVAKDGDKVVGFIFGCKHHQNIFIKFYYRLKILLLFIIFLFSWPGRRGIKISVKTEQVNKKLKKGVKQKLDGHLALFIVDSNYRNAGIGKTLEKDFCTYLANNHAKNVYLYTDTYSNYRYYEKKGYVRSGEITVDFKIKGEKEDPLPIYFIYVKQLGE